MRSTLVCSALCAMAMLASGCCVSVTRSGDCGPDRCSTGLQNRLFGGGILRGCATGGCDNGACQGACDSAGGAGCGCQGAGGADCGCAANGAGCNCGGGAGGAGGLLGGGVGSRGGLLSGGRFLNGANGDCGDCNGGAGGNGGLLGGRFANGMQGGLLGGGAMNGGAINGGAISGGALSGGGLLGGGALGQGAYGGGYGGGAIGGGLGDGQVALASFQGGCGRFGCGVNGKYCLGCRLKGAGQAGHPMLHRMVPNGMAANHPYGGQLPHTEPIPSTMGPDGSAPTYQYPYYTLRGPRDFLLDGCGPAPVLPYAPHRPCLPSIGW